MRSRICGGFSVQFGSSSSLLIPSRRVWHSYKDFGVERFRLRSNYYNYRLALLAALCAAEPLFKLVTGISITNPDEHAGFAPFELVSLIIEAFTWCLILVMLVVETKVYIRELRWYVRFGVIYAVVANIVMLSLTLPLKEYYTRSVMLLYYVEFVGQVVFGVLLLMYVPSLDPYPGYTPIQTDFVDDAKYEELPGGEQDGVILGADTRALEGPIVADKNCEKIHFMAPNIYCCGAGTAADTEAVTDMVSYQLKLHRYHTGRESRVVTTLSLLKSHLFNYQGHISAAIVLGGVDVPMKGGFNFDLCKRNEMLANKGLK